MTYRTNRDRFPRTLQEAFGPYTDSVIWEPPQPTTWFVVALRLAGVAVLFAVVLSCWK